MAANAKAPRAPNWPHTRKRQRKSPNKQFFLPSLSILFDLNEAPDGFRNFLIIGPPIMIGAESPLVFWIHPDTSGASLNRGVCHSFSKLNVPSVVSVLPLRLRGELFSFGGCRAHKASDSVYERLSTHDFARHGS